MKPYLIDVPVALIFFNRSEPLKEVFLQVKKARPSKIFLIQDGARDENQDDLKKMEECRRVFDDIDWECEVYKNYSDENLRTGKRIYTGISWAFEYVDRLIILEDDCVPSHSFFKFCEEVLEKYKSDERINMISGMNHLGEYDVEDSYFFAETGSIWGWATWKRVWENMDYDMEFLNENETMDKLYRNIHPKRFAKKLAKTGKSRLKQLNSGNKLTAWSYQFGMIMYLQSQLIIVPQKNLISNIGVTNDSVHAFESMRKIPKSLQKVFFMKKYDLTFPLTHPKYIVNDVFFASKVHQIMNPNLTTRISRKVESIIRNRIF